MGNFNFLDKTINLLVIAKHPKISELLDEFVEIKLYNVIVVKTIEKAKEVFLEKRIHVCLLEFDDSSNFALIDKQQKTFFIIVIDKNSAVLGFEAAIHNVKNVFGLDNLDKICDSVNYYALLNIINPIFKDDQSQLNFCTKVLLEKEITNETELATHVRITDRQLRNIWKKSFNVRFRDVLKLHYTFRAAFKFYENQKICKDYKQLEEYFLCHRSNLLKVIQQ